MASNVKPWMPVGYAMVTAPLVIYPFPEFNPFLILIVLPVMEHRADFHSPLMTKWCRGETAVPLSHLAIIPIVIYGKKLMMDLCLPQARNQLQQTSILLPPGLTRVLLLNESHLPANFRNNVSTGICNPPLCIGKWNRMYRLPCEPHWRRHAEWLWE